jgi:hypothetical protein
MSDEAIITIVGYICTAAVIIAFFWAASRDGG